MENRKSPLFRICVLILIAVIAGGCGKSTSTATPTLEASLTQSPSPTVTPQPGKVLFVSGAAAEARTAQQIQQVVGELAAASGLTLENKTGLEAADLTSDVRVVVLTSAPANLEALLSAGRQTQFIVITNQSLAPAVNLNIIHDRPDYRAFVAGYIAEAISVDWRAAGILAADGGGNLQEQAFINGGRYFCGICQPAYTPLTPFPIAASIPAGSDAATGQAAASALQNYRIYTIYIAPEVSSPDLLGYLAGQKVLTELGSMNPVLLLGGDPPPENIRSIWVASIQADTITPLRALWQPAVNGEGGQETVAGILLTDINEDLLGIGKQRLVQDVINGLVEGFIEPLNVP